MPRKKVPPEVQQAVRQRARFICRACEEKHITLKQYAHIIPDADGGEVDINNILWLCESCQRRYEVQGKTGLLRDVIIANLKEFRDAPKLDSLVDGLFDELMAHPDQPVVIKMGSVAFQDLQTPLTEPPDSYRPAYFRFYRDNMRLKLEGHIKNINGFTLIEFDGKSLHFNTKDIWDIERRARYLKIYSKSQKVWIEIKQNNDLSVSLEGEIYIGGRMMAISKYAGLQSPGGLSISGFTLIGNGSVDRGILLPPSPIPRPYGHSNPNVPS